MVHATPASPPCGGGAGAYAMKIQEPGRASARATGNKTTHTPSHPFLELWGNKIVFRRIWEMTSENHAKKTNGRRKSIFLSTVRPLNTNFTNPHPPPLSCSSWQPSPDAANRVAFSACQCRGGYPLSRKLRIPAAVHTHRQRTNQTPHTHSPRSLVRDPCRQGVFSLPAQIHILRNQVEDTSEKPCTVIIWMIKHQDGRCDGQPENTPAAQAASAHKVCGVSCFLPMVEEGVRTLRNPATPLPWSLTATSASNEFWVTNVRQPHAPSYSTRALRP
ncbi:hypothetical protein DFJ77DRAFT_455388 [Powellomyces hirtus]|nr:hypothetical protein DFJ77DRAFT_455388 [Powellomyces hirtus]